MEQNNFFLAGLLDKIREEDMEFYGERLVKGGGCSKMLLLMVANIDLTLIVWKKM